MSHPTPPNQPRSPSIRTTATHTTSESAFTTTTTTTTEHQAPAWPAQAQRAIRQQASIHFPPRPVEDMDMDMDIIIGDEVEVGVNRQPSLSFLTHDPAEPTSTPPSSTHSHSHTPSVSASASPTRRSSEASMSRYLPHRISGVTTRSFASGMADAESRSHSPGPGMDPTTSEQDQNPGLGGETSFGSGSGSGMAVKSPSFISKPKSLKSTTSTSSKSRKRASNSTIHRRSFQRKYGKWEYEWDVDMSPLIEEGSKRREEELELAALLGRATVLERMLKAGRRVSGTPISSLKHLASHSSSSRRGRAPSRSQSQSRSRSTTPKRSLSISIRSVRRHLSRRLRRKTSRPTEGEEDDAFTEIESQSGFGSAPPVEVLLSEKERGWVVLLPEKTETPPPLPEKEGCLPSPTCLSSPSPTKSSYHTSELGREDFVQTPHLGHREPDYHRRQSVLSYISVGRWSASTQGARRRRGWVIGVTVACLVGVIVLTGILAGVCRSGLAIERDGGSAVARTIDV